MSGKKFKLRYVLILVVLTYFGTAYYNQAKQIYQLQKEKEEKTLVYQQMASEVEEKRQLVDKLEKYIESDKRGEDSVEVREFIEKVARDEGMIKEGEVVFIDKDKKTKEERKKFYNNSVK